jgi:hypothetical protein
VIEASVGAVPRLLLFFCVGAMAVSAVTFLAARLLKKPPLLPVERLPYHRPAGSVTTAGMASGGAGAVPRASRPSGSFEPATDAEAPG